MKHIILLADDEPDAELMFRQNFRREIRNKTYTFCFARSGSEALGLLQSQNPDDVLAVLSDINMPVMNGFELLKAARALSPSVPVLMVTANGDRETARQAHAGGALSVLTKPVDFSQLRTTLSELAQGLDV